MLTYVSSAGVEGALSMAPREPFARLLRGLVVLIRPPSGAVLELAR
jgi:hypothetical protein